jgi:uncharacterized hydrophobic protein (TIGR00341 family)
MAQRLIEIILPREDENTLYEMLKEFSVKHFWHETGGEKLILVKLLLASEQTETVLDALEKRFSKREGFKIIILPVEASIPRAEEQENKVSEAEQSQAQTNSKTTAGRIYREELYADINDVSKLSRFYLIMVVLSSLVAATGILRNSLAIIIGAMLIAPLLGPHVALSLATTLGDTSLGRQALKAGITGIMLALAVSAVLGVLISFDPRIPEVVSRTKVGMGDLALALAAGAAGTLAFTTGASSALIGVMVAVALLPPLVTCGLLLGAGRSGMAMGAFLLFLTNMICINLAGVATFLLQGIRPLSWWEATVAKKATFKAMLLWIVLLAALVIVIHYAQKS